MRVLSVVGARPQFVKASAVSRILRRQHEEVLVHTGQHYDDNMSKVFFDELEIPEPDFNLGIGSGRHGEQTAAMLSGIEGLLISRRPDWMLVYGDTNSTLAGALAASKLRTPVAHVEAGLRSFNRAMPEEINRVIADHLSDLLLCPSSNAIRNLSAEGISRGVHMVGDVMADVMGFATGRARDRSRILHTLGLRAGAYYLATVHRAENTDDTGRLKAILEAFGAIGDPVIFPVHPRTRKAIHSSACIPGRNVRLIDPIGYLDMVMLQQSARMILTDSGGIQKEAYWAGVPCVTLRDETEWVETVQAGWNVLAGADADRILRHAHTFAPPKSRPPLYGGGDAAGRIVDVLSRTG